MILVNIELENIATGEMITLHYILSLNSPPEIIWDGAPLSLVVL